jgi:hypothetical protein
MDFSRAGRGAALPVETVAATASRATIRVFFMGFPVGYWSSWNICVTAGAALTREGKSTRKRVWTRESAPTPIGRQSP